MWSFLFHKAENQDDLSARMLHEDAQKEQKRQQLIDWAASKHKKHRERLLQTDYSNDARAQSQNKCQVLILCLSALENPHIVPYELRLEIERQLRMGNSFQCTDDSNTQKPLNNFQYNDGWSGYFNTNTLSETNSIVIAVLQFFGCDNYDSLSIIISPEELSLT